MNAAGSTGRDQAPGSRVQQGLDRVLAILRISLGWVFLWPFLDKTSGLGFATPSQNAWINGGSPTAGFLTHATSGPSKTSSKPWQAARCSPACSAEPDAPGGSASDGPDPGMMEDG